MYRFAVANMKGGVGKTATAVNLAAGLARRGLRVLLLDCDPQGNVAHALGLHSRAGLRELVTGEAPLPEVIVRDVRPGLDVLPATTAAFSLDAYLTGQMQRETVLVRRLGPLDGYGALVCDTSPAMSLLTVNALLAAPAVLVPVTMEPLALVGARQTLNGILEMQPLWPERAPRVVGVIPTMVRARTRAAQAGRDALAADARLAPAVLGEIAQDISLTYATAAHATIWEYAPSSQAAKDYERLLTHLMDGAAEVSRHAQGFVREVTEETVHPTRAGHPQA
jgi:chromosome partitioning protein